MANQIKLSRPQPVGILPIPFSMLVLPDAGPHTESLLHQLIEGAEVRDMPQAWLFYQAAQQGNEAGTSKHLEAMEGAVADYNRFVMNPTPDQLEALRNSSTGELRELVEIVAYAGGLIDEAHEAKELDGELLALALMTHAAEEIDRGAIDDAIATLDRGAIAARTTSPLFAAQLLSQLASLRRGLPEPGPSQARAHYREALSLLGSAQLPELRTDLWMQLATTCQEGAHGRHDWLTDAIGAYQEVHRGGLIPEHHPELFALAHNNLGLLYLSMQMGENSKQLSMAIAVQSFREGLRLCDRETYPYLWASLQLNLANALQYLPSSHPEENLVQAVELYEELVTPGRKAFDPVGYGKILSNQANALAHLGIFSPALEKLQEARKLFEWHNESELASSVMELAGQIHEQVGTSAGRA